jgi:cytochrome d ubiquinol oxidase subunit II
LRNRAYGILPFLTIAVGVFLLIAFLYAAIAEFRIMGRWFERPYLFLTPALGVWAAHRLVRSLVRHDDFQPFRMVSLVFIAAFATLAISFWPYMIPFSLAVQDALAPESSLNFMFWPGVIVLPLICAYSASVYWLFRGKVRDEEHENPAPVLLDYSSTYPENSS